MIHFGIAHSAFRISTSILVLLAFCTLLFFFRLGDRDLCSSHEARAAQNAQSMLDNNRWLLPQLFDRQVELQKPPLFYWMAAWLAQLRGRHVDAWSVRLPSALAASATVLLVFMFGWLRQRPLAGFLAAAMLATCVHFTWLARVGRIDMPLTFVVSLALICIYQAQCGWREQNGSNAGKWLFVAYVAMGLGLLLKGPIGMALPLVALLCRLRLSAVHKFGLWWGLPLALGIAAPWYVLANQATGGKLFDVFFWHHNVARGLGGAEELAAYPFWYYVPRVLIDLFPWSLALIPAAWIFLRRIGWRNDPMAQFGLQWSLTMFVFFSVMQFKRADYLLPLYPGVVLFLGCVMERCWKDLRQTSVAQIWQGAVLSAAASVVVCIITGWIAYASWFMPSDGHWQRRFAQEIRRRTDGPVVFFRTEAHDVSFHTHAPIATILEWENLDAWAARNGAYYVVMSAENAEDWGRHLQAGTLQEISLTHNTIERPLVLLRTQQSPDRRDN